MGFKLELQKGVLVNFLWKGLVPYGDAVMTALKANDGNAGVSIDLSEM